MKGYFLISVSALCLGITNFLFPRASKTLGAANATFYYYVCASIIALIYWVPTRESTGMRLVDWQWAMYLALAMFASNLSYSYGVKYFDTALPSVVRSLSFFVTALMVICFSREPALSVKDWLALALVGIGIVLFGYDRSDPK